MIIINKKTGQIVPVKNSDYLRDNEKITFNDKDLIEALNHLDELADIGSNEGEEKRDQEKSYNFLFDFIKTLSNINQ